MDELAIQLNDYIPLFSGVTNDCYHKEVTG